MAKRNQLTFTVDQLKRSACYKLNKDKIEQLTETKQPKRSKYGNKKTVVDDIQFDSEREANYYKNVLKVRLKAGEIGLLERQIDFELNPGGTYSYKYRADFIWVEVATGEKIVCDVKGMRTREYIKKCRLMLKVHNIKIKEV
jgi:hypothetical protein